MSSHNDDHNHSTEPKKVQFRTPLIMGFVTVLLIFLAVSTCDPKHGCCEDPKENCESKCEKGTPQHGEHEAAAEVHTAVETVVDTNAVHATLDTLVKETEVIHKAEH
jgi:hypothetical protein